MKFDLMIDYEKDEFYEEFKRQHPNGTYGQFQHFWNIYKSNRCSDRVKITKTEGIR